MKKNLYMLKQLILLISLSTSLVLAISPAKPGVTPSAKVQQFSRIFEQRYSTNDVANSIQANRNTVNKMILDNVQSISETKSMGFPVIMGAYSDGSSSSWMVDALQKELFDGPWPTITMAEHYTEMSYGKFELFGQVYGWYDLPGNAAFYEGSQSEPYDNGFIYNPPGGVGSFIKSALEQSDIDIDFRQYDNDGPDGIPNSGDDNGYVDATFFVHSGPGGEGGGPYIWSHQWVYSGW